MGVMLWHDSPVAISGLTLKNLVISNFTEARIWTGRNGGTV